MKRYAVFICDYHYPNGGMDDFKESFDDFEKARVYARKNSDPMHQWWQIWDFELNKEA